LFLFSLFQGHNTNWILPPALFKSVVKQRLVIITTLHYKKLLLFYIPKKKSFDRLTFLTNISFPVKKLQLFCNLQFSPQKCPKEKLFSSSAENNTCLAVTLPEEISILP